MLISHILKKIASILLLGILLFNAGGYHLFTNYLESRADNLLEASLDENNYNEADLLHIKVAANLPYYTNAPEFERVNGEIDINGIHYKYVKRRMYNDSVELLCIPNIAKTGLENARNDFYRLANDLVSNNNSSKKSTGNHSHTSKFSVQDFTDDHHCFSWQFWNEGLSANRYSGNSADLVTAFLGRLEKPPQA
ncbi:MAG: hypothetical protein RLZZ28_25 [Bacteroidota bacterium]